MNLSKIFNKPSLIFIILLSTIGILIPIQFHAASQPNNSELSVSTFERNDKIHNSLEYNHLESWYDGDLNENLMNRKINKEKSELTRDQTNFENKIQSIAKTSTDSKSLSTFTSLNPNKLAVSYSERGPIVIDGNTDFNDTAFANSWPGNGTAGNPFIIDSYNITGTGIENLIDIRNTDYHYRLTNLLLVNGYNGTILENVTNGEIHSIWSHNHTQFGMMLNNSRDVAITNVTGFNNGENALILQFSSNITITEMVAYNNGAGVHSGIAFVNSHSSSVSNSMSYENGNDGIVLWKSNHNSLDNNIFYSNNIGIDLINANFTQITDNEVYNNWYGLNIHFSYDGDLSNILSYDNTQHGLLVNQSHNFILTNFTGYNNGENAIILDLSTNIVMSKLKAYNNGAGLHSGIAFVNSHSSSVSDSMSYGNGNDGIVLWNSNYNSLDNNLFYSNFIGIDLINANFTQITDNEVYNNWHGLNIHRSYDGDLNHITTYDNTQHGLLVNQSHNFILTNITGYGNGENAVILDFSSNIELNELDIHNNGAGLHSGIAFVNSHSSSVSDSVSYGNGNDGIVLWNSNYNSLDNNLFYSNFIGIDLVNANFTQITDNEVYNNWHGLNIHRSYDGDLNHITTYDNAQHGLLVNQSHNFVISNVNGFNNNENALILYNSSMITLDEIEAYGNGAGFHSGIVFDNSHFSSISDSSSYSNSNDGIILWQSNSNEIENNTVYSNGNVGIEILFSNNVIITENRISNNGGTGGNLAINLGLNSEDNLVEYNNFVSATGNLVVDDGTNSIVRFNYWSDWSSPDIDFNGIVDTPRDLLGTMNSQDLTPLTGELYFFDHPISTPAVQFPNGGEALSGTVSVEWSASVDSLSHVLSYSVWVSTDNGLTWTNLVSDLTTPGYDWDTTQFANSESYVIRIEANDPQGNIIDDISNDVFTINNLTPDSDPPVISANLTEGETYSDDITVVVNSDESGNGTVYLNGNMISTLTFSSSASFSITTSIYVNGTYNITIVVEDTAGNMADIQYSVDFFNSPPPSDTESTDSSTTSESSVSSESSSITSSSGFDIILVLIGIIFVTGLTIHRRRK
ncbi:MAG: right-handed parallel beta-helix repeat-containing protein [Candidatus Hodarchaeales archaeon]|jgi:parallel beta-helix repeat protein